MLPAKLQTDRWQGKNSNRELSTPPPRSVCLPTTPGKWTVNGPTCRTVPTDPTGRVVNARTFPTGRSFVFLLPARRFVLLVKDLIGGLVNDPIGGLVKDLIGGLVNARIFPTGFSFF